METQFPLKGHIEKKHSEALKTRAPFHFSKKKIVFSEETKSKSTYVQIIENRVFFTFSKAWQFDAC